jgi:hypothetical protein
MEQKEQRKKCTRCKTSLTLDKFTKKRDDTFKKSCDECLEKQRARRVRDKCPHNRDRYRCKDCGGSGICPHNRQRYLCKVCGGSQVCPHNRQRSQCKICSDPVKITLKKMVSNSRKEDKKYNRYDANFHINYCFLEGLVEDYTHCYWDDCKVELQYSEYKDDLATIERLDNDIGHIKSNCVLACMRCNKLKKSNQVSPSSPSSGGSSICEHNRILSRCKECGVFLFVNTTGDEVSVNLRRSLKV